MVTWSVCLYVNLIVKYDLTHYFLIYSAASSYCKVNLKHFRLSPWLPDWYGNGKHMQDVHIQVLCLAIPIAFSFLLNDQLAFPILTYSCRLI